MNNTFYQEILNRQARVEAVPANQAIADWALGLLNLLYPERGCRQEPGATAIEAGFDNRRQQLLAMLNATKACSDCNNEQVAAAFFDALPELYRQMNTDIRAILSGDPAATSEFEVIRCYPGFLAIALYRIAHELLVAAVPILPRILTEYAHSVTGIDIHPGASIGEYLYIDHGTGLVIGETTVIGNHVKLYQGVTLGALSVEKYMANTKRHPTIGDHVIIYSGATILGGDTVVGDNCIIGGNVWLTKSVPAGSVVYHQSVVKITETKKTGHE
ncbi:serine O-acetyltransferase EpsC [Pedobacter yulinensis]|uniref:serine O-acetyltransferase EpsC n=1 Tax=Pedobacter yulinensis TaxID=2126353 RepID=UPI001EF760BD|nr:serine O-acetyltransferase EpsC [Pedobacter yulinensis]